MCDKRQETKSTEPPQSDNSGVNVVENLIICTSCYVGKITFSSLLVLSEKLQTGLHFAREPQVVGAEEITFIGMVKSRCALWNFLMEVNKDKRQSASPSGNSEVKPGNDNSVSRQKQLAYPSEYSRWCPRHLCWASYILASANTDEGGGANPKCLPYVSGFFSPSQKATGAVY